MVPPDDADIISTLAALAIVDPDGEAFPPDTVHTQQDLRTLWYGQPGAMTQVTPQNLAGECLEVLKLQLGIRLCKSASVQGQEEVLIASAHTMCQPDSMLLSQLDS